jgi:translocator protein
MRLYGKMALESLCLIGVIFMNFLANYLPLGGRLTGQVSAAYPTLFTPDGLTFSIWGLIYSLLIVYIIRKWWKILTKISVPDGQWFIASCFLNVAWLFAWHYELLAISLIFMLGLLSSLWLWLRSLRRFEMAGGDVYWYRMVARVYFAWISVATIANIAIWLVSLGGLSFPSFWTLAALLLVTLSAFYRLFKLGDFSFVLIISWAFAGIYRGRTVESGVEADFVGQSVLVLGVLLLLSLLVYAFRNWRK